MTIGVIGFTDSPDHSLTSRPPPPFAHAFARVAAPAFNKGLAVENTAMNGF